MEGVLQHSDFEALVGQSFVFTREGINEEILGKLIIAEKSDRKTTPDQMRIPFAIEFQLSLEHCLPQGTYSISHERLKAKNLFFVPVGKDEGGWYMEACFN